jgi:N-acetyl-gamma-glutamyl-phosphate reductase
MTQKIKIGIAGGAGYTAGELLRIAINHPNIEIDFIYSTSNAGNNISDIHQDLIGQTDLKFTSEINKDVDVVFLCLGHGNSKKFIDDNPMPLNVKIIDLSNDFRLKDDAKYKGREFVYGLLELNKNEIKQAQNIANPGCFATAIQLAVLPLAKAELLKSDLHINAITGSTGAGVKPSATTHFSWRNDNISTYKEFSHQHLGEISETLMSLQNSFNGDINFLPLRGNFSRGIFATMYCKYEASINDAFELYSNYYKDYSQVVLSLSDVHLKQVTNTNKVVISLQKNGDKLLVTSLIDNLLKGASGQAIQNFNLMFGLEENTGLNLKANYF